MDNLKPPKETKIRTTVLVIDNDAKKRSFLVKHLLEWGYIVFESASDDNAWKSINECSPEILISGIFTSKCGTFDLCRQIKEYRIKRYIYVIILADKFDQENLYKALISGADDFLVNPWHPIELRARIRAGDRIIALERELHQRIEKLEMANQLIMSANDRMKKDLYAVAKIQTSLLPDKLPELPKIDCAWEYRPKSELAGDGLNVFRIDEKHVAFYVLDVSGTGTPAALLSVSLSRVLSPYPTQSNLLKYLIDKSPGYKLRSPSEILKNLNDFFPLDIETNQFFTIFFAMLNIDTFELRYASAGHPMPVVVKKSGNGCKLEMLPGGGFPIGFVDNADFEEYSCRLLPGDRVYAFSDGLSEAQNESGDFFGKKALQHALKQKYKLPLKKSVSEILQSCDVWCAPKTPHDDISVLAFEIKKSER